MTLFATTMDYAFKVLGMNMLRTEVFKYNKRVVKLDKLLGYRVIGEKDVEKNGKIEVTYVMELQRNEWDINRFE